MITRREKRGSRSEQKVKRESSWMGNIQRKGLIAEYTG